MQKMIHTPISIVVPAYNEKSAVGPQVKALQEVLSTRFLKFEVLVVDDGSTDGTAEEALKAGARVLQHTENRGYGSALKTGIAASQHETIVIIDADGTYPTDQIPVLVTKLGSADMVVGARDGRVVRIPWARRPAKWLLGWLAQRVAGKPIVDLNSGLRVFRRSCVKQYFSILSNRFSFTTTVTLALLADDYRVVYHTIDYYRRVGKSKITPRHFLDFMILVLRMAMLFQPLRVFLPLALSCGALGVLKVIYDIAALFPRSSHVDVSLLYQPVISTSAILLLIAGLQLLLIGMVADGILRRIGQQREPLVDSQAVQILEPGPYSEIKSRKMVLTADK